MKNVKNTRSPTRSKIEEKINPGIQKIRPHNHYRRGIVDVQFNWIFVLIAGFVIFLFIISIAFSQKKSAENQASIDNINQITTLLKGKQQTANMYSEISFSRSDVEFRCTPDYYQFSFKIANSQPTTLPVEIIFAPKLVNTNKLMVWSQPFDLGFPVSVFAFVTTANSAILIFNDTDDSGIDASTYDDELSSDLDFVSNITHKFIKIGDEYSNFARRTIVCFEDVCPNPALYDYIKITPAKGLFDYGNVTFHKKGPVNQDILHYTYPYITKAGLYGAIFSDSPDFYSCQMTRALSQFEIKRQLVQSRLFLMQEDLPDSVCKEKLNVIMDTEIASMQNPSLKSWENISNLYTQSKNLDIRNTDLNIYCPKMYLY